MREYNKIETLFRRDEITKKIVREFNNPTFEFLKDNLWDFTEKVDGTNLRICWDGHRVTFGGRTDNASLPAFLVNKLNDMFGGEDNEQLFEQKFGENEVILCCEAYGNKIGKAGKQYFVDKQDFIMFDVMVNGLYLERSNVEDIAKYFGLKVVPILLSGTLEDAVQFVLNNRQSTVAENGAELEGLVGKPRVEMLDRLGKRVITKIKYRDIKDLKQ